MANPEWDNHDPNHGKLTEKQLEKLKKDIVEEFGEYPIHLYNLIVFLKQYKFED